MQERPELIVDTFAPVAELLQPWTRVSFWEFADHATVPGAVYVLGRKQLMDNIVRVRAMCESSQNIMVFDGSAEGSSTLQQQIRQLGIEDLVLQHRLLIIGGGAMPDQYPYMLHEHFINVFLGYEHNQKEMIRCEQIHTKTSKPCTFLFLNGRARPHRKYLWERFNQQGLLHNAIWTQLDPKPVRRSEFVLIQDSVDLLSRPGRIQRLPPEYEVEQYRNSTVIITAPKHQFIKHEMFANTWGEVYLQAEPYVDTYFSVITETVYEQPHSFRTEKIVKALAAGHPFIVAANRGFYRDLHNLGFCTFDSIIDESFDSIDLPQDRMDRICEIVADLCAQDLASFLAQCYTVCKYNQQHLLEVRGTLQHSLPDRFFKFLQQYS